MTWLIIGTVIAAGLLAWRLAYAVEWRRDRPGRHAVGFVEEVSHDEYEPITEVLPVVDDEMVYDPNFYRLGRAVRRWTDVADE